MADGTAQGGTAVVAGDEITTDNGATVTARQAQRVKIDAKGVDGAFTDTSAANPLPVYDPDVTASGTIAALSAAVTIALNGDSGSRVQITGTWTGTLQFEATVDGTTWVAVNAIQAGTSIIPQTTTVNGTFSPTPAGFASFRVVATAWTSGTATVSIRASSGAGGTYLNHVPFVTVSNTYPTITNRSGTIAAGGTAQVLAAANTARNNLTVQNTSATLDLWLTEDGVTTAALNTHYKLSPGAMAQVNSRASVSIWGATTGQTFAASES